MIGIKLFEQIQEPGLIPLSISVCFAFLESFLNLGCWSFFDTTADSKSDGGVSSYTRLWYGSVADYAQTPWIRDLFKAAWT